MRNVKLICIGCPLGCLLDVETEGSQVLRISGNTCQIGEQYAHQELTNPTRIVTSTVRVVGGTLDVVSVKTSAGIPRGRLFDCIKALKAIDLSAPVAIGDVIIENVCGTGISVVATRSVPVR